MTEKHRIEGAETASMLLREYGSLITTKQGWLQVAPFHGHSDRTERVWGYERLNIDEWGAR